MLFKILIPYILFQEDRDHMISCKSPIMHYVLRLQWNFNIFILLFVKLEWISHFRFPIYFQAIYYYVPISYSIALPIAFYIAFQPFYMPFLILFLILSVILFAIPFHILFHIKIFHTISFFIPFPIYLFIYYYISISIP